MTTYRILLLLTAFSSALITAAILQSSNDNYLSAIHAENPALQQHLLIPKDTNREHEMLINKQLGLMTLAYSQCANLCDFLQVKYAVEKARHYDKFGI